MKSKMYVPVMSGMFKKYRNQYMKSFSKIGDMHPVLCIERTFDQEKQKKNIGVLEENIRYLDSCGIAPFVWTQAFGFGIPLDGNEKEHAKNYTRITDFDGITLGDAMCPLDEAFMEYYKSLIQEIAKAGAKRIMLDDDLCLSVRPGLGCSCEKHLKRLSDELGMPVDRSMLKRELFKGEGSRLRSAWLKVMGDTLISFCRQARMFADEINPDIEMGFCAGYTSWDIEGVDAVSLTKVLAGKNKPFLRLTGAPYWVEQRRFDGQGMAQIVEFTRMQRAWCEKENVEIFTENDSYPRPRYRVPSAILETFDFCMAADSEIGQLKYLFEYYSSPEHETGYVDSHLRNKKMRDRVQKEMARMKSIGIHVYEPMRKVENMAFGEISPGASNVMMTAFSQAADLLSSCTIPTTYEKTDGVVIAFGDSGRTVHPDSYKGCIIDYPSAIQLMKRGVDVGIVGAEKEEIPFTEKFLDSDDQVLLDGCVRNTACQNRNAFYRCSVKSSAQIESVFPMVNGEMPASYRYENEEGQKFLVFLFDAGYIKSNSGISCSYYRQKQIIDACEWMGAKLPAVIKKHPGMYMIAKEDDQKFAIAVTNFSLDPAYDVEIELKHAKDIAEMDGMTGEITDKKLKIKCIPPWSSGYAILRK